MSNWSKHKVIVALPILSLGLLGMVALMSSSTSSETAQATTTNLKASMPMTSNLKSSTTLAGTRKQQTQPVADATPSTFVCTNFSLPVLSGVDVTTYRGLNYDNGDVPGMGSSEFSTYSGVYGRDLYYFASEENLQTFLASPSTYWPQFGAFCTYGVSVEGVNDDNYSWDYDFLGPFGDPNVYEVYDDKLYIFMSDTPRGYWMEDAAGNSAQGQARWAEWAVEAETSGMTDDYYLEWQPMNTMCLIDSTATTDATTVSVSAPASASSSTSPKKTATTKSSQKQTKSSPAKASTSQEQPQGKTQDGKFVTFIAGPSAGEQVFVPADKPSSTTKSSSHKA